MSYQLDLDFFSALQNTLERPLPGLEKERISLFIACQEPERAHLCASWSSRKCVQNWVLIRTIRFPNMFHDYVLREPTVCSSGSFCLDLENPQTVYVNDKSCDLSVDDAVMHLAPRTYHKSTVWLP